MKLEIDAGNSRIKWRLLDKAEGVLTRGVVAAYDEPEAVAAGLAAELQGHLTSSRVRGVEIIRVASVRGSRFRELLNDRIRTHFGVLPNFARVSAHCEGLKNSYAEPDRMGVDRWLAMVAAWCDARRGLCVVDAGSALTIDLVSSQGQHLGGYIVPGLRMMLAALSARSSALSMDHEPFWSGVAPGNDTRTAVEQGALSMSLGLLERVNRLYPELHWYLTGGDAGALSAYLDWEHVCRPDLVLDGLAPVLREFT